MKKRQNISFALGECYLFQKVVAPSQPPFHQVGRICDQAVEAVVSSVRRSKLHVKRVAIEVLGDFLNFSFREIYTDFLHGKTK